MTEKNNVHKPKKKLLKVLIAYLILLSASILAMGLIHTEQIQPTLMTYFLGILFWTGVAGITVITILFLRYFTDRRSQQSDYEMNNSIFRLFQDDKGKWIDILMLISVSGMIVSEIWMKDLRTSFIFLALFVFSFGMHYILSGIVNRNLWKEKRNGTHEKEAD